MSTRGKNTPSDPAAAAAPKPARKDERWDDRLRRVGDANYVHVEWSGRDQPVWPLPTK
jgi:hypothetical protein